LGTSGGSEAPDTDAPDEFAKAFASVFKRRA